MALSDTIGHNLSKTAMSHTIDGGSVNVATKGGPRSYRVTK